MVQTSSWPRQVAMKVMYRELTVQCAAGVGIACAAARGLT